MRRAFSFRLLKVGPPASRVLRKMEKRRVKLNHLSAAAVAARIH
jgi:hypothetical protein